MHVMYGLLFILFKIRSFWSKKATCLLANDIITLQNIVICIISANFCHWAALVGNIYYKKQKNLIYICCFMHK